MNRIVLYEVYNGRWSVLAKFDFILPAFEFIFNTYTPKKQLKLSTPSGAFNPWDSGSWRGIDRYLKKKILDNHAAIVENKEEAKQKTKERAALRAKIKRRSGLEEMVLYENY